MSLRNLESELILDANGGFRFFMIDSNTAFYVSKGKWFAGEGELVRTGVSGSYLYHGGFKRWDTLAEPDTSYLRNVSDSGFERLEAVPDTLFGSILRWVRYRIFTPQMRLPQGRFEFMDTFPNGVDTQKTDTGLTRLQIASDSPYVQYYLRNGTLTYTDVDSLWVQAGSFLITSRNRHCAYGPGYESCGEAPAEYEYVARLDQVAKSSFRLWIAPDFTYQSGPFWATFK